MFFYLYNLFNMKFLHKSKAVIIYLVLLILFLLTFLGLGFYYSRTGLKYDFTVVSARTGNINYATGTGDNLRASTSFVEGMFSSSVDFTFINSQIIKLTSEEGITSWEEGIEKVLEKYEYNPENETFLYDGDDVTDKLNNNEKATIILYVPGSVNESEEKDKERAIGLINHGRPVSYYGDDGTETDFSKTTTSYDVDSSILFNQISYGVADSIFTNADYTKFRVNIRNDALWEDGQPLIASDIVFTISRQIPTLYASQAAYMITSIADLQNVKDTMRVEKSYTILDDVYNDRWDLSDLDSYYSKDVKNVYYGLMPTKKYKDSNGEIQETSYSPRDLFKYSKSSSEFKEESKPDETIVWHDRDESVENDNSYIEFNLNTSSPTFVTQLPSASYLPIDVSWYFNKFGTTGAKDMSLFALDDKSFKSNGAYKLTKFDNSYGSTFVKNENYWDANLVKNQTGLYRMMNEATTQVSMFDNGFASYVYSNDTTSKSIKQNPDVGEWVKDKFTPPSTKYAMFNLSKNRTTEAAKFLNDPNLRRAISSLFDRNAYHRFSGLENTQPTSIFTPLNMYKDTEGKDFVDFANETTFEDKYNNSQGDPTKLEAISEKQRFDIMKDPTLDPSIDENFSVEKANYYWDIFINDMKELDIDVPSVINITFLTTSGSSDPFIKTLQEGLSKDGVKFSNRLNIVIRQETAASFWATFTPGINYDLGSILWNPDYLDIWSMLGVFNAHEPSKSTNGTSEWTYFDGSDYAFIEGTYGSKENDDKARTLFNDGISSLFEENETGASTGNILNMDITKLTGKSPEEIANTMLLDAINDNLLAKMDKEETTPVTDASEWINSDNRKELTYGINRNKHSSKDEAFDPNNYKEMIAAYLVLEAALKDGSSIIVGSNERPSSDPSSLMFEGDPVFGYPNFAFSIDLRANKKTDWVKELNRLFNPS